MSANENQTKILPQPTQNLPDPSVTDEIQRAKEIYKGCSEFIKKIVQSNDGIFRHDGSIN